MAFPACPICLSSPANCPVQIDKQLCSCKRSKGICLTCCRNLFQLDRPNHERDYAINCLYCRDVITLGNRNAHNTYTKCDPLWEVLDTKQEDQKCGNCEMMFKSPYDLEKHLNTTCQDAIIKCSARGCTYRCKRASMKEHEDVCQFIWCRCYACQERVKREDLAQHKQVCRWQVVVCPECGVRVVKYEAVRHANHHVADFNMRIQRLGTFTR